MMLQQALSLCEEALAATDATAASRAASRAIRNAGAISLQTRLYRRPGGTLTNATHWDAGGFIIRDAPSGWVGSPGYRYICFDQNPLLEPIRRGLTRYRFTDFAPRDERAFGTYWEAFTEGGFVDGLCATAYGRRGGVASVHLGLGGNALSPGEEASLWLATGILAERLMEFGPAPAPEAVTANALTSRERDALAYVAEGKTDWEIGIILGVSQATARFHVDNARRKLDAVNRAHAVARFLAIHGPA